jgi:hypothetical protein
MRVLTKGVHPHPRANGSVSSCFLGPSEPTPETPSSLPRGLQLEVGLAALVEVVILPEASSSIPRGL